MLRTLRDLPTGRSWRARLSRGRAVPALGGLWMAPTFGALPPLALYNTSDSVPEGLYLYAHDAGGPAGAAPGGPVAVKDPPHFDLPWLLKRVAGKAGDRYCWNGQAGSHELNGRLMPAPDPEAASLGIGVWKGCGTLAADEVVLYGRTPDSYDSRFLGPVHVRDLWGVYRPVRVGP